MSAPTQPYPTLRELRAKIRKFSVTPARGGFGLTVVDDLWAPDGTCCGLGIALLGRITHLSDGEFADLDAGDLWGDLWAIGYVDGFDGRSDCDTYNTDPYYMRGYRLGSRHARALLPASGEKDTPVP